MFSSHGTEEEELEAYTYAEDEERRRQFRENMLEGLKVGEEDGYGGEDSLPDNGLPAAQNGGADRKENVNSAALPSTERLPTFHPRKNQALRNTFGFIAPGGTVSTPPCEGCTRMTPLTEVPFYCIIAHFRGYSSGPGKKGLSGTKPTPS
jgi:hypothetical protein